MVQKDRWVSDTIIFILLKKARFSYVRVSWEQDECQIDVGELSLEFL